MNITLWTDEEIEFLKTNYMTMTNREISEVLGRTEGAVANQIRRWGLVRPSRSKLSADQDDFLKKNYGKMPTSEIAARFGCHPRTVTFRAYRLGLNAKREKRCPRCGDWASGDEVRCPECALWLHTRADCHSCAELVGTRCSVFTTRDNPPLNKYGVCHGRKMAPARNKGPTKLTITV